MKKLIKITAALLLAFIFACSLPVEVKGDCPTISGTISADCTWTNDFGINTLNGNTIRGVDQTTDGQTNSGSIRVDLGATVTVGVYDTVVVGEIDVSGTSGQIVIVDGGEIKPGSAVWYESESCDTNPIIAQVKPENYIHSSECFDACENTNLVNCSCDSSLTDFCTIDAGGDTVYVDCNVNKCWSPTAVSIMNWDGAISHCNDLNHGGSTDWHPPNLSTLENLCNSGSCLGSCFGSDGSAGWYWSSTEDDSSIAWNVHYNTCVAYNTPKTDNLYVRCVKDSLCDTCKCDGTGYETVICNGDTVYVDCSTDTCWTPTASTTYPWSWNLHDAPSCIGQGSNFEACHYCDTLNHGGNTDWYLPDLNALLDLCFSNACSTSCFGSDSGSDNYYWSSTEEDSTNANWVYFNNCNYLPPTTKWSGLDVRCARKPRDPRCDTCACDGTGDYETITCNGAEVYLNCDYFADTCWTPTTGPLNRNDAIDYCNSLSYGGNFDWILANPGTLNDNLCQTAACSGTCFGGEGYAAKYWSAMQQGMYYIYTDFSSCTDEVDMYPESLYYVRCYRWD